MNTSAKPTLIGIAGSFSSGKDTIAEQLVKDFGFVHISTSDMVREIAMEQHGSIERPILHKTATDLRQKEGAGVLVERAVRKKGSLVITGLRTLGEAKAIKAHGGVLIFVDAPVELRYERMRSRQRDQESVLSLDEFKANEEGEWYEGESDADFNVVGIKKIADLDIDSSEPREEFIKTAYEQLGLIH